MCWDAALKKNTTETSTTIAATTKPHFLGEIKW